MAAAVLVPQTPPRSSPASLSSSLSSGLHGAFAAPRRCDERCLTHKPWLTSNMIWNRAPSTPRPSSYGRVYSSVFDALVSRPTAVPPSLISPPPNAFSPVPQPAFPKTQRPTVRCHEDSLHRDLPLERGHRGTGRAAQQPRGLGVRVLPA